MMMLKNPRTLVILLGCLFMIILTLVWGKYQATQKLLIQEQIKVHTLQNQLDVLVDLNQRNNNAIEQLQSKNQELLKTHTERRQEVKRISNENKLVKDWGDVSIPDDIKRLLQQSK